jgi:hypothetical protein
MASFLEELTEMIKVSLSGANNILQAKNAHAEAVNRTNVAADTLVATAELNALNKDIRDKKSTLKQVRTNQDKQYNALKKKFEALGTTIEQHSSLSPKDITENGFDWLGAESDTAKTNMFKTIQDINSTDLTIATMDRDVKTNKVVLDNLDSLYNNTVNSIPKIEEIGRDAGVKGMMDMEDVNTWLSSSNADNPDITNEDAMSELSKLAFEKQLPDMLAQEKRDRTMDIPSQFYIDTNKEGGILDKMVKLSPAQISQADESIVPLSVYNTIESEKQKGEKAALQQAETNKKLAIKDASSARRQVDSFLLNPETKKYGDFELTDNDFYGDPRRRSDLKEGISPEAIKSELVTNMNNIYKLATKYLDDSSKLKKFDDFVTLSTDDKYKLVQKLLSTNDADASQSLLKTNGEFKSDKWDFSSWPKYGGIDDDKSGFTRAALNSLRDEFRALGTYLESNDFIKGILNEEDPNAGKGNPNI